MYVYKITNTVNNKKYIGITNDYKKRWSNHKNSQKNKYLKEDMDNYGLKVFDFKIIHSNLSLEEACIKEISLIREENSKYPNGYNIQDGGIFGNSNSKKGEENGKSILTEEEVRFIKNNRNIPEYVLYDMFSDKISYDTFRNIYKDLTWKHITTDVEEYPNNLEFSCQFSGNNCLEYDEVVEIRKKYDKGIPWREVYKDYKDRYSNEIDFWNVYSGNSYKLVMPEVFTEENKKYHASMSKRGEKNSHAKLNWDDVHKIRKLHKEGYSNKEIYRLYPQISSVSVRNIISNKTWIE